MARTLFLFFLLFCAFPLEARDLQSDARALRLWEHPRWRALGHYKKGIFGWKSQVDDPHFFLSPRGKRDPEAELEATLELLSRPSSPAEGSSDLRCRYPARAEWLRSELQATSEELPVPYCHELDAWLERLNGQSLTLVFAAAYLNAPASMYGHTFLRLDQEPRGKESLSLLSYSINFAADTRETNGVLFALRGLAGGYPGRFSTVPYYMKIQEYSNMDSRDLWEYQLHFSSSQIRTMLLHLWEIGGGYFNYYFLARNCSYQLLPLLEIADPALDLSSRFRVKTVPLDTVRVLEEVPGLVGKRFLRPSAISKILAARSELRSEEIPAAETIARDPEATLPAALDSIPAERRGPAMRTAYQYFRYRHRFARYLDEKSETQERRLLVQMNQLEMPKETEVREASDAEAPEYGHRSGRIGFLAGQREDRWFGEVALRPALHDLLDDPQGYGNRSKLEMFTLNIRYSDANEKAFISRLACVDLLSLSPLDRWIKKPSWGVSFGADQRSDVREQSWDTLYFHLNGVSGISFELNLPQTDALFYALAQVDGGTGPTFKPAYRIGPGALSGISLGVMKRLRLLLEADYRNYLAGDTDSLFALRATPAFSITKDAQLRFTFQAQESLREFLLGFYWSL